MLKWRWLGRDASLDSSVSFISFLFSSSYILSGVIIDLLLWGGRGWGTSTGGTERDLWDHSKMDFRDSIVETFHCDWCYTYYVGITLLYSSF